MTNGSVKNLILTVSTADRMEIEGGRMLSKVSDHHIDQADAERLIRVPLIDFYYLTDDNIENIYVQVLALCKLGKSIACREVEEIQKVQNRKKRQN